MVKLSEAGTAIVHAPTTAQTAMTPQYNLLNASDIPQIIKNESKLITSGEQKILLKRITVEPKNTEYTMHIFPPSLDHSTLESLRHCTVLHEGVQKPLEIFHILGCEYTIKVNNTTGAANSKISGLHYNFPEAQDVL